MSEDFVEEYPTEEELAYVEKFDCTENDVRILIDKLEELWWAASWGFVRTTRPSVFSQFGVESKEDLYLELHTGGWSGNEDLLRALKKNEFFYCYYWEESRVGGHEGFRFTHLDKWELEAAR